MTSAHSFLRYTALAEAVSYLLLLFIAMPMKYLLNMPLAVQLVGSIHGALFVLLCIAIIAAWKWAQWPISRLAVVFFASLIPFVPFYLDKKLFSKEVSDT